MLVGKVAVGVSGVLLDDSGYVLLLRHRFHHAKRWGMPGGWLSPGETIFDCWRREVKEELGLTVAIAGLVSHRATRHSLEFFLHGRINGGELKVDPVEIVEARFFSSDALPRMERFLARVIMTAMHGQQAEMTASKEDTLRAAPRYGSKYMAGGPGDSEDRKVRKIPTA